MLRKMRDQQQKHGYDSKVKAWLEKPEKAELVKSIKATVSPHMKPEQQAHPLVNSGQELYPQHGRQNQLTATGMRENASA